MRFDIMTLFPELVDTVLNASVIGRARNAGILDIRTYNIRDYSEDKHRRVDDTPYGGGRGMLMAPPPIWNCYQAVLQDGTAEAERRRVIFMSPKGTVLSQEKAKELSGYDRLILLCGHYEGVDQRILDEIVDEEISVGDYVVSGGEIPACLLVDCVARLQEGVLALPECYEEESFYDSLLEYPQYTRPPVWHGQAVPEILISGDHAKIDAWRLEQAKAVTAERRPDLFERYTLRNSGEKD